MNQQELNNSVLLSSQRALLGVITPNIRMITIGWEGLKKLHVRAYYDMEPNEEDIEEMNAVCAEIDSDIPFEKDCVECIFSEEPLKDLKILSHIVFARKENSSNR